MRPRPLRSRPLTMHIVVGVVELKDLALKGVVGVVVVEGDVEVVMVEVVVVIV